MATQQQIDSFYELATRQIRAGHGDLSLAELFDLWQVQHPSARELAESVAAVKSALSDMEQGDTGRHIDEFVDDMRTRYGISSDE